MANTLFDKARYLFLRGELSWAAGDIKAILIDTGNYTFSASSDYLANIPPNSRISTVALVDPVAESNGAANAADTTFQAVGPAGTTIEAIILYKDTTVEATSPLIAYIDTATGLPITANGGDIIVTWDNGTNKIFRL